MTEGLEDPLSCAGGLRQAPLASQLAPCLRVVRRGGQRPRPEGLRADGPIERRQRHGVAAGEARPPVQFGAWARWQRGTERGVGGVRCAVYASELAHCSRFRARLPFVTFQTPTPFTFPPSPGFAAALLTV